MFAFPLSGLRHFLHSLSHCTTHSRPLFSPTNISFCTKKLIQKSEVTGYATADEYLLKAIYEKIKMQGLYDVSPLPVDMKEHALHLKAHYEVDTGPREIFLFRDGASVFWNMSEQERLEILRFLHPMERGSYDRTVVTKERDSLSLTYVQNGITSVSNDGHVTICLSSLPCPPASKKSNPADEFVEPRVQLDQYAISNALALSVKLGVWEDLLEVYIEGIDDVTNKLRQGRRLSLSREQVLRKAGELFTLRHCLNLSSDMLDPPDVYWDRDLQEKFFLRVYNHFTIGRRVKVMNEKLNHCCQLTDLISSHLNELHHFRLEWLIIFLIAVEVGFEVLHLVKD